MCYFHSDCVLVNLKVKGGIYEWNFNESIDRFNSNQKHIFHSAVNTLKFVLNLEIEMKIKNCFTLNFTPHTHNNGHNDVQLFLGRKFFIKKFNTTSIISSVCHFVVDMKAYSRYTVDRDRYRKTT